MKIKICAFVDFMGTMSQTPEEEYEDIKNQFCEELDINPININFVTQVQPYDLRGMSTDIYVIDYGGILPGSEDLTISIYKELLNQIQEKPNTLFVIWSTFSFEYYQEVIENENPEFFAPNVVFALTNDGWNQITKWIELIQ